MQFRVKENVDDSTRPLVIHEAFTLQVHYITPKRRQDLYRRAFIRKNQEVNDDRAQEAFARSYAQDVIRGWSGLTLDTMERVLRVFPVDEDRERLAHLERDKGEIPYDEEIAVGLFRYALAEKFQQRITDFLSEIDNEAKKVATDRGNASGASSGS